MDPIVVAKTAVPIVKGASRWLIPSTYVVDIKLETNSSHTTYAEWICHLLRCTGYRGVTRNADNTIVVKPWKSKAKRDLEFFAAGLQHMKKVPYTHDSGSSLAKRVLFLFCEKKVVTKSEAKDLFNGIVEHANVEDSDIRAFAKQRLGLD